MGREKLPHCGPHGLLLVPGSAPPVSSHSRASGILGRGAVGQSGDTQPGFTHTSEAELLAHCGFCCSQVPLVQQSHREPQDSFPLRPNPYSNCGNFPDAILTGECRPPQHRCWSRSTVCLPLREV